MWLILRDSKLFTFLFHFISISHIVGSSPQQLEWNSSVVWTFSNQCLQSVDSNCQALVDSLTNTSNTSADILWFNLTGLSDEANANFLASCSDASAVVLASLLASLPSDPNCSLETKLGPSAGLAVVLNASTPYNLSVWAGPGAAPTAESYRQCEVEWSTKAVLTLLGLCLGIVLFFGFEYRTQLLTLFKKARRRHQAEAGESEEEDDVELLPKKAQPRFTKTRKLLVGGEGENPDDDSFTRTFKDQPELLEASAADLLPGESTAESSLESSE